MKAQTNTEVKQIQDSSSSAISQQAPAQPDRGVEQTQQQRPTPTSFLPILRVPPIGRATTSCSFLISTWGRESEDKVLQPLDVEPGVESLARARVRELPDPSNSALISAAVWMGEGNGKGREIYRQGPHEGQ
jgi:hypothetical protein